MKIQYWKTKKGEFNYHLISRNGNILVQSTQGYKRKATMLKLIKKIFCANIKIELK